MGQSTIDYSQFYFKPDQPPTQTIGHIKQDRLVTNNQVALLYQFL